MKQQPLNVYVIWDWWLDKGRYITIYEKEGTVYFSEVKEEEIKLLEYKKNKIINILKRIFKWIRE